MKTILETALTAIEDFIEESEINFSFEQIEAFKWIGNFISIR